MSTNSDKKAGALTNNRMHRQGHQGGLERVQDGGMLKRCHCVKRSYSRADSWLDNIATSQAEISADRKFYLPMRSVFADSFGD